MSDERYKREDGSFGYVSEDYYDDLKKKLRKENRENIQEWIASMVGDKAIIRMLNAKLVELEDDARTVRAEIHRVNTKIFEKDWNETEKLIMESTIDGYNEKKKQVQKKKTGIEIRIEILKGKKKFDDKPLDIEGAKEYPMGELLEGHPAFKSDGREFYKCPVHEEKTASFCWFKRDNKGHCFGCQWHGDSIDLYQKIHNCDFVTAVKYLSRSV